MSSNCNSCSEKTACSKDKACDLLQPKFGRIRHIVGVVSGKGGVGKSSVTGLLAVALEKLGKKVGVLDADITGPSIPRFFGVQEVRSGYIPGHEPEQMMIAPAVSERGILLQSMNFLMEQEEQPVLWRGPVISSALVQLYQETAWGDLDYLLIDMPPGTGDVAISVMTQFPVDYFIVVSTPQNMVGMIVAKIVNMIRSQNIPIRGVIQNMAYFKCDECLKKHYVFSQSPSEAASHDMGLDLLAELPLDPALTMYLEDGQAEAYAAQNPDYEVLMDIFREDEEKILSSSQRAKQSAIPILKA